MDGIQIEYLLGLYFIVSGLGDERPFVGPVIRFVAGIILLVCAILHKSFI